MATGTGRAQRQEAFRPSERAQNGDPILLPFRIIPLSLSRLAPWVPYGLCPLTVLTPFGGKEVGELWHFLSWVHSCPTPSATFKGPSNSSEMGVGGWSARLQAQPSPPVCYKCSKVGPFYFGGFQQKISHLRLVKW